MAKNTSIEWCHDTLNLWWGCSKVSDGCKFCYAEALADTRYRKGNWGPKGTRREVKSWRSTLNKISREAKESGVRRRVFCQSMSDTFEGPETMGGVGSYNWNTVKRLQDELLTAVLEHPELDFLLLTKRPENVLDVCHRHDEPDWDWPSNVWIGTSCEDQKTADERIPHLLRIPVKVRFLSCEPLLGPVTLPAESFGLVSGACYQEDGTAFVPHFDQDGNEIGCEYVTNQPSSDVIHWVICGGESGPNARPMHPDWARSLRDQCQAAGVAFHFKQWGEYVVEDQSPDDIVLPGSCTYLLGDPGPCFYKVGKHRSDRLLDGRTWDEFPEVAR